MVRLLRAISIALVAAICAMPALGQATCRQALAIGLDVSGSVDQREYRLQLDGLAAALLNENVQAALFSLPDAPVSLAVYEWSGAQDQLIIVPWTAVSDGNALNSIVTKLRTAQRQLKGQATALGTALITGRDLLNTMPHCWKRTLDLSGDGKSNEGPRPRDVKEGAGLAQITVNALVIGEDHGESAAALSAYFRAEVISGPDAFVEVAHGFDEFEAAMVRKLLKELSGLNLATLTAPQ
ncbi:DUF1194 domain-containing protein [Actibacterium lipolyticum]|nr:DUF1194 domain-containing protein [Actibacterium lipolyticum]